MVKLDAIGETPREVVHEMPCGDRIAHTDHVAGDQLRIGVNGRPRPDIPTNAVTLDLRHCDVLLFAADELPDFVNLNALTGEIDHNLVEVRGARFAQVNQQL